MASETHGASRDLGEDSGAIGILGQMGLEGPIDV